MILFIGTLALTTLAAAVGGGVTLISTGIVMPDFRIVYEWLGVLGGIVNQIRACVHLGDALFRFILFTMSQPLFWGYVIVVVALTASWFRVMQMIYRRTPIATTGMLV
jgi:hypothetical protein